MKLPRLVLLPGLDGTGLMFEPLLAVLPLDLEATVVQYPTDQPLGYADLLPIVLDALPRAAPYVLLGESFSGPLAVMAARRATAGLLGVVLCASFVRNPTRWPARLGRLTVTRHTVGLVPAFIQSQFLLGRYATDQLRSLLKAARRQVAPAVMAARVRSVLGVDVTDELRRTSMPLLDLRASDDRLVRASSSRWITTCRPDAHQVSLPAPHLLLQTRPVDALAAIRAFVDRTMGT